MLYNRIAIPELIVLTFRNMAGVNQDELKMNVKLWLNGQRFRLRMARRTMFRDGSDRPQLDGEKAHSRRQGTHHPGLIKQLPLTLPSRVQVEEETLITLKLDPDTRKVLEKKAFSQGKTLKEFLADEVPRLGNPPLA